MSQSETKAAGGAASNFNTASADKRFQGVFAQIFKGMSPIEITLAFLNWSSRLAMSPGQRAKLTKDLLSKLNQLDLFDTQGSKDVSHVGRRYASENWQRWPFNKLALAYDMNREWWKEAVQVEGVNEKHQQLVDFVIQQMIELLAPANFLPTNPDLIEATRRERGDNVIRGASLFVKDTLKRYSNQKPGSDFVVGENVAVTPGKVIFRNNLLELIQYEPATPEVGAEPVLIMPPWIYKYYILDLSPRKSMMKYLVEQGKTVFTISWKNPTEEDRDVSFEDYINEGFFAALDVVNQVCPNKKVNAVGYCLGGTILSVAAAAMARDGDDRLNTISLFTAQVDFTEAGEITKFISEGQLAFLEKLMWKQGFLSAEAMAGSFAALQPGDLIYGPMVDRYVLGNEVKLNDLMSWNADPTRMPGRMHSEYLRSTYLNNEIARNKFTLNGRPIALSDIRIPIFNLGTESDHVAPWLSVYKLNDMVGSEVTFCLTSSGHNAGVACGPDHPRRRHRILTRQPEDNFVGPQEWVEIAEKRDGSWWPSWSEWLDKHMSGKRKPPRFGAPSKGVKPIVDAPGEYVFG